jgi:hypothetical protein
LWEPEIGAASLPLGFFFWYSTDLRWISSQKGGSISTLSSEFEGIETLPEKIALKSFNVGL